jgi:hypothetical protein
MQRDSYDIAYAVAKIIWFLALTILAFVCIDIVGKLPNQLDTLIREQSREWQTTSATIITQQLAETRNLVSNELSATRKTLSSELTKTRADLRFSILVADSRAASIQADLNARLLEANSTLDMQLTKTEADLAANMSTLNSNIATLTAPMASVMSQVNEASPLFLDCDHNSDCLFNRWVGMGRSIEKVAENGAETSKNISKLTEDLSKFTNEITKPKPWYKHIIDYGKLAVYTVSKFVW